MGLLTVLKKLRQKEKEIRILMLGLDNAGKTTLVKRMNGENIHEVPPTLGFNISTFDFQGFKLNIWDIGGQKSLRSYWRNYFEETDALVWVIDSADRPRLQACKQQLYLLLQEERLAGASLLIFANKQDIPHALTCQEISEVLELSSIRTHHWHMVPCSAFIHENIVDSEVQLHQNILNGIHWVTSDVASRIFIAT